jgi:hypothetical protein
MPSRVRIRKAYGRRGPARPRIVGGVRVAIQVDACVPLSGEVTDPDGHRLPFAGWLGLLAILSGLFEPQPPPEVPGGGGGQFEPGVQVDLHQDVGDVRLDGAS